MTNEITHMAKRTAKNPSDLQNMMNELESKLQKYFDYTKKEFDSSIAASVLEGMMDAGTRQCVAQRQCEGEYSKMKLASEEYRDIVDRTRPAAMQLDTMDDSDEHRTLTQQKVEEVTPEQTGKGEEINWPLVLDVIKGKAGTKGEGKGNECFVCGKSGHYARECWFKGKGKGGDKGKGKGKGAPKGWWQKGTGKGAPYSVGKGAYSLGSTEWQPTLAAVSDAGYWHSPGLSQFSSIVENVPAFTPVGVVEPVQHVCPVQPFVATPVRNMFEMLASEDNDNGYDEFECQPCIGGDSDWCTHFEYGCECETRKSSEEMVTIGAKSDLEMLGSPRGSEERITETIEESAEEMERPISRNMKEEFEEISLKKEDFDNEKFLKVSRGRWKKKQHMPRMPSKIVKMHIEEYRCERNEKQLPEKSEMTNENVKSVSLLTEKSNPMISAISADTWVNVELTVDSGAEEAVAPTHIGEHISIEAGNKLGVEYEVANGATIPNLGERRCKFMTEACSMEKFVTLQVADVHKALLPVSKIVDNGHTVVFSLQGSYIQDGWTGEKMEMKRTGGTYVLNAWLKAADFHRQGQ